MQETLGRIVSTHKGAPLQQLIEGYQNADNQHLRNTLQQKLDRLGSGAKQCTLNDFFKLFGRSEKFPSLDKVSRTIEDHATDIVNSTLQILGVKLLFSGYDSASSVSRKLAIPGSDLDHWVILHGGKADMDLHIQELVRKMCFPLIIDPFASSHAQPIVLSLERLSPMLNLPGGHDSFYLYKLPFSSWSSSVASWRSFPSTQAKPFVESDEKALINLQGVLAHDTIREDWVNASCFVEIFRDGRYLSNVLDPQLTSQLEDSKLFKESNILRQRVNLEGLQSKHHARNVFDSFNTLGLNEQFLVLRMLMERRLWHESTHPHLFNMNPAAANYGSLLSLVERGFLVTDKGTAVAPWLDHYPNVRGLPFDY